MPNLWYSAGTLKAAVFLSDLYFQKGIDLRSIWENDQDVH